MTVPLNVSEAIKYYRALCFGTVPDDLCVVMAEVMAKVPEQLKKIGIETSPRQFATAVAPAARPRTGLSLLPDSGNFKIYHIVPFEFPGP
jgi:hypothetical protein